MPLHGLAVCRATDLTLDPLKSTLPRYGAYIRARHRFWEALPGGLYTRLPTPGTDLECGLHALRLSMLHQLPPSSSSPSPSESSGGGGGPAVVVPVPTIAELREVFRQQDGDVARENERAGLHNDTWFTADQLAAVFSAWGRRQAVKCQMGYVSGGDGGGVPVMMNTPEVETGEVGEGIVRVWVWNDGASLRGGVGHFEGIRMPSEEEVRGLEKKGEEAGGGKSW